MNSEIQGTRYTLHLLYCSYNHVRVTRLKIYIFLMNVLVKCPLDCLCLYAINHLWQVSEQYALKRYRALHWDLLSSHLHFHLLRWEPEGISLVPYWLSVLFIISNKEFPTRANSVCRWARFWSIVWVDMRETSPERPLL